MGGDEVPPGMEKMTFTMPQTTDEERLSQVLPEHLECDVCRAIEFHMPKFFQKLERRRKVSERKSYLNEGAYIEAVEMLCSHSTFSGYGIKEVNGNHRLSGPGTEAADTPGVISGGGRIPTQMMDHCKSLVDDYGEKGIYEHYRKNIIGGDAVTNEGKEDFCLEVTLDCLPAEEKRKKRRERRKKSRSGKKKRRKKRRKKKSQKGKKKSAATTSKDEL